MILFLIFKPAEKGIEGDAWCLDIKSQEMQIKTTVSYHFICILMAVIKKTESKCCQGIQKLDEWIKWGTYCKNAFSLKKIILTQMKHRWSENIMLNEKCMYYKKRQMLHDSTNSKYLR